jgi:hypothetical protein
MNKRSAVVEASRYAMKGSCAIVLVLAFVAGCASDPETRAGRLVQIPLNATTINGGHMGRASLVAVGERTEVELWVSGVPPFLATRPVHLYTYVYPGTCAKPGAEPAFALTEQVLAQSPYSTAIAPAGGPFTLRNIVSVPLDVLARGPFALRVFTAPYDGNREIFCGDLG